MSLHVPKVPSKKISNLFNDLTNSLYCVEFSCGQLSLTSCYKSAFWYLALRIFWKLLPTDYPTILSTPSGSSMWTDLMGVEADSFIGILVSFHTKNLEEKLMMSESSRCRI